MVMPPPLPCTRRNAADEHADAGESINVDLAEVDHQTLDAGVEQLREGSPELRCGVDVDLSAEADHTDLRRRGRSLETL
jgi:hypothetical protein